MSRGGRKVAWRALHRGPPTDHDYLSLCKPRLSRWPGLGREPRGGQGSGSGEAGALGVGLALASVVQATEAQGVQAPCARPPAGPRGHLPGWTGTPRVHGRRTRQAIRDGACRHRLARTVPRGGGLSLPLRPRGQSRLLGSGVTLQGPARASALATPAPAFPVTGTVA